jgi:uncharacterized damage-inducible protein DinB
MLINSLTEEALNYTTSKRGGGTVGYQLAHIYNMRFLKLEKYDKSLITGLTTITAEDPRTISMLKDCHKVSAELIGKILEDGIRKNGEIKGFKRGVVPLLGYFISHEGHHRGNILLTLKNCGFKIPDELKYGIWDWNKV